MFDRPQGGARAILVHMSVQGSPDPEALQEFRELAVSAGAEPVLVVTTQRRTPDQRLFIGSGKAEEIQQEIEPLAIDLVIFDHELSPSQERNLEKVFACRVLDRTGLILDIFAQRACSHEGKLQVELAQLRHLSTRLIRGWTHLERQKGGIGLRGPGETQLETDRRLLGQRVQQIHKRLQKVESQRGQSRRARQRAETPTVSVVGYTNAGKSTLFNSLTQAQVYAQDQLFATLDPTLRRVMLGNNMPVVLADTVGFVSRLPHELVAAFKSTLQETVEADLLLHVIDAANPRRVEHMADVDQVLAEIGATETPQLLVYNKIDLLDGVQPHIDYNAQGQPNAVWLSAATGEGADLLLSALQSLLMQQRVHGRVHLSAQQGRLRAKLFAVGQILQENHTDDGGWELEIDLDSRDYARIKKQEAHLFLK
jgi:GTP-binding protein HflX